MADFHQNGIITTFHNFRTKQLDHIERELEKFSEKNPIKIDRHAVIIIFEYNKVI